MLEIKKLEALSLYLQIFVIDASLNYEKPQEIGLRFVVVKFLQVLETCLKI